MPTSRPVSPAELAARVRAGVPEALAEVYHRYGDALMALAYRLTGSIPDAEDVVHDVFVGLPEALRRYDERGAFEAWLKRVTARVALSRLRGRARAGEVPLLDDVAVRGGDSAQRLTDSIAVARAIATLPESLRVVVVLREIEGYSHAEIGDLLEITAGASEVRLHRALKQLRAVFGESA